MGIRTKQVARANADLYYRPIGLRRDHWSALAAIADEHVEPVTVVIRKAVKAYIDAHNAGKQHDTAAA